MSATEPAAELDLFFLLEQLRHDREALLRAYAGAEWSIPAWEWLNLWEKYRVLREGLPRPACFAGAEA